MSVTESWVVFVIGDLLKTSGPGIHMSGLFFYAYPYDSCLCVADTIKHYLDGTSSIRGSLTGFFLTTRPLVRLASWDPLCCWVRDVMGALTLLSSLPILLDQPLPVRQPGCCLLLQ
ncbi:hypothetical protein E2C01_101549 [Portunus trituberculatus]|uniref:Uncharacterized protein n=1 Tax=Portunus trituberculatus TaxID=210409 RepID=A0A5B7KG07_PORTR|nr:hypothetical protein [Portunus trituberculatus]